MMRLLRQIALLTVCLVLLPATAAAEERILEYNSDIQVHTDGQLTITERIRVRAEGTDIKRGIYRDFPTRYRDRAGNYVNVDFSPLSVHRNGNTESWHTQEMSNGVRVYIGNANRLLDPRIHEYELVFVTNRQLGYFEDHDELYFNAISHNWKFPVDRAAVTVTLPFRVAQEQLTLDVYTGHRGSKESNAEAQVSGPGSVRFATTRSLAPGEGMTIAIAWPKGLIPEPDIVQKARWFLADNAAAIVLLLGFFTPFGWYLWAWSKVGRDPEKGVIIPRFEPPHSLSPAACRYVKDMSFDRDAFTAAIISLAVKGQLDIEEEDKEFSLVRVPSAPMTGLTKGEQAVLMALLPSMSSSIEMKNENHEEFQKARQALKKALKNEYLGRLFQLNGYYLLPPVLMSVAAVIIALFFDGGPLVWISFAVLSLAMHLMFVFLMRAPTPAGRRVMDEIEGFEMYLDTAEQDRLERMRSPALTPEVFEAFLPYAYALGVENNWCKRFAREIPEQVRDQGGYHPGWYSGNFHGISALNHLGDNFSSSFSSAIASASSPPGSSSGSGGGGFSGGGGGGGGGGGW